MQLQATRKPSQASSMGQLVLIQVLALVEARVMVTLLTPAAAAKTADAAVAAAKTAAAAVAAAAVVVVAILEDASPTCARLK
mmetsp:Transcript_71235/g.118391  ORF Transcript_71235/g.118391 Transcript_71235/m.118391 type:complete len:82 (+) Transcript_71235:785-1030(+)